MTKLTPELKKQWVEALRSGEYQQGQGRLCQTVNGEDYYCCLGVFADIAIDDSWVAYDSRDTSVINWAIKTPVYSDYVPLNFLEEKTQNQLILLNDDGHDFHAIADYIEENL